VADFYAARDNTMPPLPWPSIAPPFTAVEVLNEDPSLQTDAFVKNVPGAKPETVIPGYSAVMGYQCAPGQKIVGRMSEEAWQSAVDVYTGVGQMADGFDVTTISVRSSATAIS